MKLQYAIPSLLCLSTAISACADPIVGDWTGESFTLDGQTLDIPYVVDGVEWISSLDMTVETDLTGVVTQESSGVTETNNITVSNNGGGNYTISSDDEEGVEDLDCNLSGSSLSCSDSNNNGLDFTKGTK